MRRLRLVTVFVAFAFVLASLGSSGCAADPEAIDPGTVLRANAGSVRCSADEGGNLHVRAPADARVTIPPDARGDPDPTVEVAYAGADETAQMPRPERPRSRSLGFIGDAPLTQGPNYGGRYSYGAHDNALPPHAHSAGYASRSSFSRGYGYRSYGHTFAPRGSRW